MTFPLREIDPQTPVDGPDNGAAYYRYAQLIMLNTEAECERGCPPESCPHAAMLVARAQVFALLAIAAAIATNPASDAARQAWARVCGVV